MTDQATTEPRYFLTVPQRLDQAPVSSIELMPSPSMFDELLNPLWWTPDGVTFEHDLPTETETP